MATGIDFNRTFGQGSAPQGRQELPKANTWLNIGYSVEIETADGGKETRFVSLPVGIPLDTQEPIAVTSRNEQFAQFQSARNDLLAQLQAAAASLKPGEEKTVNLEIQLRRINDPVVAPAAGENMFSRPLNLA